MPFEFTAQTLCRTYGTYRAVPLDLGWLVVHTGSNTSLTFPYLPHTHLSLMGLKFIAFLSLLQLEKLDTDLKNYKSNSIKESIR